MAEKSILEQALLQMETLEEALKQNAKGILGSVVKQELNGLLKESKEQEDEQDVNPDEEEGVNPNEEEEGEMETPKEDDEEFDDNSDEDDSEEDMGSEFSKGGPSDEDDSEEDMGPEFPEEEPSDEDDDVMDMTGASDSEVLKVFKAMKPQDGIVVKKDGNNLDIEIDGDEYVIKLDELDDESEMDEMSHNEESLEEDMSEEDMTEDEMESEETVYEIELDGEDDEDDVNEKVEATEQKAKPFGSKKVETKESKVVKPYQSNKGAKKIEATEAARTKWNPHGNKGEAKRSGLPSKKMFKAGSGSLNEEVTKLRKQNDEYKKALILFKEKLNEVAVFNASLAYATRIFTEHSTTKQEKLNILKRFDTVSNMNESKNLYSTIATELSTKKPVTESVAEKISTMPKSSSSKEVLSESKAYENEQFKRMKELMAKIK